MYNNEEIGVSAEVAIAAVFNVPIASRYLARSNQAVVTSISPMVQQLFASYGIPSPVHHIAEGQNPVDFTLSGDKTLSVKTNQKQLGKVAPQKVGQASSKTFFPFFTTIIDPASIPLIYSDKVTLFKSTVYIHIHTMLGVYWDNLFDCDYLVHFYDILTSTGSISGTPKAIVLSKKDSPAWNRDHITFTKETVATWNESNTVKYHDVTIGEFQIHNNRDNFKFRFNMAGLAKLTEQGVI